MEFIPASASRRPAGRGTRALLKALPLIASIGLSSSAVATPALECVAVDAVPGGGARIRNGCTRKIAVAVCVTNARHWWPCGGTGGLIDLAPGADYPVQDLKMWPGHIRYAACLAPENPSGWNGASEHQLFTCK